MDTIAIKNNKETFIMVKVEEALKTILDSVKRLSEETVNLADGLNRVLAEDIYADIDIPQLDNTAMDGYAVRAEDTRGTSQSNPIVFEVIEDLKAGYLASKKVNKNQAIRIMTGAAIPEGADSIVIVEDTSLVTSNQPAPARMNGGPGKPVTRNREYVKIFKEAKTGENIRRAGEDIKKGEKVISKGTLLNSAHIGVLASLGKSKIRVTKKPKVAILATGDEVVDIDEELKPEKLRSSNTYTLSSQVLKLNGIPKNLGIAKDEPEELEKKLKQGFDCNLILSSGGVSVGDYDFVKFVLAKLGTNIKFWKVAMRPGKPLVFGVISTGEKEIPMFGLPGNPVSSMISFEVFVRPTILKMLGQDINNRNEIEAIVDEDIDKKKGLRYFVRAKTNWKNGAYHTKTTGPQGSGILKSMMMANSLIILEEEKEYIKKGTKVTVGFLD